MQRKLKLILSLRMPDNLFKSKIEPLTRCPVVARVVVVCDHPAIIGDFFTFPTLKRVIYHYPPLILQKVLGRTFARIFWLARVSLKIKPDLLMSYAIIFHGIGILLVAKIIKCKAIHQLIGGQAELSISSVRDNRMLRLLGRSPVWLRRSLEKALRWLLWHFDAVVVKGSQSLQLLQKTKFPGPILLCPGGVDVDRFKSDPLSMQKTWDVITVSRLSWRKNIATFIESVSRIRENYPMVSAVIIGSGPEASALHKLIHARRLQHSIEIVPHRNDIEVFLKQARVFLLCSISEGLSTAVTEAMAMGLPAVVSDVGDMRDLVVDGSTGRLVPPPFCPEDFAAAILELLADRRLSERMGRNGRALVMERFSITAESTRWHTYFHLLIKNMN